MNTARHPRLGWIAWLPAVAALSWCVWLRVGIPEPAGWVRARGEDLLPFVWGQVFDTQEPCYVVFRAAYVALLATGLDFVWSSLLPWCGALLLWLACRRLARRLLGPDADPRPLWLVDLVIALWVFHPMWGTNWLLAGRIREVLAPLGFVLALGTLIGRTPSGTPGASPRWAGRWMAALGLVVLAVASDDSGLLAWLAAVPAVLVCARRDAVPRPWRSTVVFAGWGALAQVAVWFGMRSDGAPGLLAAVMQTPGAVLAMATGIAAPFGEIGRQSPSVVGVVILLAAVLSVLLAWMRRAPMSVAAGVWSALVLYGVAVVLATTDRFFGARGSFGFAPPEFVRETTLATGALLVGACGLLRELWPGLWGACRPLLLGGAAVLLLQDWPRGIEHLVYAHGMLASQAVALCLDEAAPDRGIVPDLPPVVGLRHELLSRPRLADLRRRGLLDGLPRLERLELSALPAPGGTPCGDLEGLPQGAFAGRLSGDLGTPVPGMVIVVRSRGAAREILACLRPTFVPHRAGATFRGAAPEALQPGDVVTAFGLRLRPWALAPLRGGFRVGATGPQPLAEAGR